MAITVPLLLNAASGLLFIAFGIVAARLRPREIARWFFSAFCLSYGIRITATYVAFVVESDLVFAVTGIIRLVSGLFAAACLGVFASLYRMENGRRPHDHPAFPVLLGLAVVSTLVVVAAFIIDRPTIVALFALISPAHAEMNATDFAVTTLLAVFSYFALLLFVAHFRRGTDTDRRQFQIMSFALLLWPSMVSAGLFIQGGQFNATVGIIGLTAQIAVCVLWLRETTRSAGVVRRSARNLALLSVGLLLVGALTFMASDPSRAILGAQFGIARTLSVAILTYAIVRLHLFGVDVHVRWGVSRGTVAALFVAVFFVASEVAQTFFSASAGSQYYGILAAGALVFALAPLQRVADRVADRVVPSSPSAPERSDERAAIYMTMARRIYADRRVTPEEEMALAKLARELGLDPVRALELRHAAADGRSSG